MNRAFLPYLIPLVITPIALSGVFINIFTHWENEPVIVTKFFPDGEDLHLGTFLIFLAIGGSVIIIILIKAVIPKSERKENREYRAGHTGTLPKDWGT